MNHDIKVLRKITRVSLLYVTTSYMKVLLSLSAIIFPFVSDQNSFVITALELVILASIVLLGLFYDAMNNPLMPLSENKIKYLDKNLSNQMKILIFGKTEIKNLSINKYELNNLTNVIENIIKRNYRN